MTQNPSAREARDPGGIIPFRWAASSQESRAALSRFTRAASSESAWYPLDLLRNEALDKQEQEIANDLWESFMAKMTAATKTSYRK